MLNAIIYIKQRTQIQNITAHEARLIYTICAFETAWNRRKPPSIWCNLFNKDTIKALEFAEDLEYYWNDGYGYNLTYEIACPAIADMFESIRLCNYFLFLIYDPFIVSELPKPKVPICI